MNCNILYNLLIYQKNDAKFKLILEIFREVIPGVNVGTGNYKVACLIFICFADNLLRQSTNDKFFWIDDCAVTSPHWTSAKK